MEIIQSGSSASFTLTSSMTLPSAYLLHHKDRRHGAHDRQPARLFEPRVHRGRGRVVANVSIITPQEFVGEHHAALCQDLRGEYKNMQYLDSRLVELHYEMPLNEIVY